MTERVTTAELDSPADTSADTSADPSSGAALVEEDLLVEEVSIDGMCGVY